MRYDTIWGQVRDGVFTNKTGTYNLQTISAVEIRPKYEHRLPSQILCVVVSIFVGISLLMFLVGEGFAFTLFLPGLLLFWIGLRARKKFHQIVLIGSFGERPIEYGTLPHIEKLAHAIRDEIMATGMPQREHLTEH